MPRSKRSDTGTLKDDMKFKNTIYFERQYTCRPLNRPQEIRLSRFERLSGSLIGIVHVTLPFEHLRIFNIIHRQKVLRSIKVQNYTITEISFANVTNFLANDEWNLPRTFIVTVSGCNCTNIAQYENFRWSYATNCWVFLCL